MAQKNHLNTLLDIMMMLDKFNNESDNEKFNYEFANDKSES